jgi:hypothetical protein
VVRCCAPEPADRPSANQIQRMAEERLAWHAYPEEDLGEDGEEEESEALSEEQPRRMSDDGLAGLVDDWVGGQLGCGSQGSDHSRLGREFANCQLGGGSGCFVEDAEMSSMD